MSERTRPSPLAPPRIATREPRRSRATSAKPQRPRAGSADVLSSEAMAELQWNMRQRAVDDEELLHLKGKGRPL